MADTIVAKQVVDVNTVVDFRTAPYSPINTLFEMDDRKDPYQTTHGTVRVRQYPASKQGLTGGPGLPYYPVDTLNLSHVVTKGQWFPTSEWRVKYISTTEMVTGDSIVELKYPVVSNLLFTIQSPTYDSRGRAISVTGYFDVSRNAIVLSYPCFGSIKVSYNTTYRIYRYQPDIYNDLEVYLIPDPEDYGSLLGFHQNIPDTVEAPAPAVFAIQPPQGIAAEFELYRVESVAFATEDGLYESPWGYPSVTTFPEDSTNTSISEDDHGLEIARVHEIAYMSLFNAVKRRENISSERVSALPLDYTRELADYSNAGRTVVKQKYNYSTSGPSGSTEVAAYEERQIKKREAFEKYRRMLNQQPSMRMVRNEVPIAKPYEEKQEAIDAMKLRFVYCTFVVRDTSGSVVSRTTRRITVVDEFKIKLVVKAGREPTVPVEVFRDENNQVMTDTDTQMARVNTMLGVMWNGIDWTHLRKMITNSYDPELYVVTFDSSFPQSN